MIMKKLNQILSKEEDGKDKNSSQSKKDKNLSSKTSNRIKTSPNNNLKESYNTVLSDHKYKKLSIIESN